MLAERRMRIFHLFTVSRCPSNENAFAGEEIVNETRKKVSNNELFIIKIFGEIKCDRGLAV